MKRGLMRILFVLSMIILLSFSLVSAGLVTDVADRFSGGGFSLLTSFGILDSINFFSTGLAVGDTDRVSLPGSFDSGALSKTLTKEFELYSTQMLALKTSIVELKEVTATTITLGVDGTLYTMNKEVDETLQTEYLVITIKQLAVGNNPNLFRVDLDIKYKNSLNSVIYELDSSNKNFKVLVRSPQGSTSEYLSFSPTPIFQGVSLNELENQGNPDPLFGLDFLLQNQPQFVIHPYALAYNPTVNTRTELLRPKQSGSSYGLGASGKAYVRISNSNTLKPSILRFDGGNKKKVILIHGLIFTRNPNSAGEHRAIVHYFDEGNSPSAADPTKAYGINEAFAFKGKGYKVTHIEEVEFPNLPGVVRKIYKMTINEGPTIGIESEVGGASLSPDVLEGLNQEDRAKALYDALKNKLASLEPRLLSLEAATNSQPTLLSPAIKDKLSVTDKARTLNQQVSPQEAEAVVPQEGPGPNVPILQAESLVSRVKFTGFGILDTIRLSPRLLDFARISKTEQQTPSLSDIDTEVLPYSLIWYRATGMPELDAEMVVFESRLCALAKEFDTINYEDFVLYDGQVICPDLVKYKESNSDSTLQSTLLGDGLIFPHPNDLLDDQAMSPQEAEATVPQESPPVGPQLQTRISQSIFSIFRGTSP